MMGNPNVSVVMAVYNGEPYLAETVQSILNQSYTDFEFIIVDDGSTDDTWKTLTRFAEQDARLVLLRNQPNVGVVRSLNRGLDQSRGKIIVRQDADDLSSPERIQKQMAFLDTHPDYGLVAAVPQLIDMDGAPLERTGWDATQNEEIQTKLLDYMCLCGPSIAIRRECLEAVGFYFAEGLDASEDYDLCLRLAEVTKLASLGGALYLYRQHPASASSKRAQQQMFNKAVALERALYRRYGKNPPSHHVALVSRDYMHAAIISFVRQDMEMARHSLQRALEVYQPLLDSDQPVEELVRAYTPLDSIDAALRYTESVFDDLLPKTRRLNRMKARLLGDLHLSQVFAGANQNQLEQVKDHLWLGIRYNPTWLFNRGVVSILAKSMFRRNRMKTV